MRSESASGAEYSLLFPLFYLHFALFFNWLVLFDLNQNTCTYVKLLGPCFKTGHLRSFFAKASWTCQLLLPQRDLHQGWTFERFFNLFIRTTTTWELTVDIKAFPPSPNTTPWKLPSKKWHLMKKTRFLTPSANSNITIVALNDLPDGFRDYLAVTCFFSSVFLTVIMSAQVSSFVAKQKDYFQINLRVLTCLQLISW